MIWPPNLKYEFTLVECKESIESGVGKLRFLKIYLIHHLTAHFKNLDISRDEDKAEEQLAVDLPEFIEYILYDWRLKFLKDHRT